MKLLITLVFLVSFSSANAIESNGIELKPFKSDYCTMFFEGTWRRPGLWKDCCFDHDLRYWFGGTKSNQKKSDYVLKKCVRKKAGSFWANIIYLGVRAGHFSPVKNKHKWGWGWKNSIGFRSLNEQEKKYIIEKLEELELEPSRLQKFISTYQLD